MVQTLQANTITLSELNSLFGLAQTQDEQFFREWQTELPQLNEAEKAQLDRVKTNFFNLLEYPSLLENTVKMVVLSPLLDQIILFTFSSSPPPHPPIYPSTPPSPLNPRFETTIFRVLGCFALPYFSA